MSCKRILFPPLEQFVREANLLILSKGLAAFKQNYRGKEVISDLHFDIFVIQPRRHHIKIKSSESESLIQVCRHIFQTSRERQICTMIGNSGSMNRTGLINGKWNISFSLLYEESQSLELICFYRSNEECHNVRAPQ